MKLSESEWHVATQRRLLVLVVNEHVHGRVDAKTGEILETVYEWEYDVSGKEILEKWRDRLLGPVFGDLITILYENGRTASITVGSNPSPLRRVNGENWIYDMNNDPHRLTNHWHKG